MGIGHQLPLVLSQETLVDSALILPAVMCDNTHRVLSAREAHLSCGVQAFTGGQSQVWSMTDFT